MANGNLLDTYVIGFDRSIREMVEVKGGKLRPYVQLATGDLFRKEGVYQLTKGGGLPEKVTNRFGDSPVSMLDYERRRTTRTSFQDGQFTDWVDLSKMGTDPRSQKMNAMKNKFLRQEDIILDQALLGSAQGGDNGVTPTTLPNSAFVSPIAGAVDSGSPTDAEKGFTYTKFLAALETFGNNNVDIEQYTPVFKISWTEWNNIMRDDKFIDFDYTEARPIDKGMGQIYSYMGTHFCVSNILPFMDEDKTTAYTQADLLIADADINTTTGTWKDTGGASNTKAVYAFVQDAALLEINPDLTTKVSERADKSFNFYAYMKMELGAVRMEEEKVVVIPCTNA